jgi:putative ABC transport system permease protein
LGKGIAPDRTHSSSTLVFGLPLGIAAGAAVWRNVADDLGVDSSLVFAPLLLLLVPAALAVAVLASLGPARRARRLPVATLLNGE